MNGRWGSARRTRARAFDGSAARRTPAPHPPARLLENLDEQLAVRRRDVDEQGAQGPMAVHTGWIGGAPARLRRGFALRSPDPATSGRRYLWPTGTYSRPRSPVYTWRGRAIFCSESSIISSHWAIQPLVRGIANRTGNMSTGMPRAS